MKPLEKDAAAKTAHPRTMMSRADLVRAFAAGDAAVRQVSDALGLTFKDVKDSPAAVAMPDKLSAEVHYTEFEPVDEKPELFPAQETPHLTFWRVEQARRFDAPETGAQIAIAQSEAVDADPVPPTEADIRAYGGRPKPRTLPIAPWSRVRPALSSITSGETGQGPVDYDELAERLGRLEQVVSLPRKAALSPATLHVLVDRKRRLVPFWDDQRMMIHWLKKIIGQRYVRVHWCPHDISVPLLGKDDRLLALTDLGVYATPAEQQTWQRLGRRLNDNGVRLAALVPCPRNRWKKSISTVWHAVDWGAPGRAGAAAGVPHTALKYTQRAEQLLTLLSATLRIEPGLLRELRLNLPQHEADPGTEADAWLHPSIMERSYEGCWIEPLAAQKWREEYASLPQAYQRAAKEAIRRWHEKREYGLFEAELLALHTECGDTQLNQDDVAAAKRVVRGILAAMPGGGGVVKSMDRAVSGWANYLDDWVGKGLRDDPQIGVELTHAVHKATLGAATVQEETEWALRQCEGDFVLGPVSDADAVGSLLATFKTSTPEVKLVDSNAERSDAKRLQYPDNPRAVEPEPGRIQIVGDRFCLTLDQIPKPWWADEMGRDRDGLFIQLGDEQYYWVTPGTLDKYPNVKDTLESLIYKPHLDMFDTLIDSGHWIAAGEFPAITMGGDNLFINTLQEDEFGAYRDMKIAGVTQRFRWIPPGEFLMGSPDGEPERGKNESQHEVILTKGFWLADTTCTQELWKAVMGDNPSHFKGKQRPVERVIWDDCTAFIERINKENPGLNLSLPTEAQWEYACRADTKTPFSFGDSISSDFVNYGGERDGTVDVKSLPANPWGLYEMHGNVVEWCADWFSYYPTGKAFDPKGPDKGEDRVLRGGAWSDNGWSCRSAYRYRYHPDNRDSAFGFRLSRGQVALRQVAEPDSEESEVKRSGTGEATSEPRGMSDRVVRKKR
jgi:formylglycine-generating enzyme required for sulfatase activity